MRRTARVIKRGEVSEQDFQSADRTAGLGTSCTRQRNFINEQRLMPAPGTGNTGVPVGDVRGYEGMGRTSEECDGSLSIDVTDLPHSSDAAQTKLAPTGLMAGPNPGNAGVPVGDVRGYEGSECGGSLSIDVTDLPHSPASRLPQNSASTQNTQRSQILRSGNRCVHQPGSCRRRPRLRGQRCGGSLSIDVADLLHSPASRLPQNSVSTQNTQRSRTLRSGNRFVH
jgi:hypothetical protein